jgi:hypothetical protein
VKREERTSATDERMDAPTMRKSYSLSDGNDMGGANDKMFNDHVILYLFKSLLTQEAYFHKFHTNQGSFFDLKLPRCATIATP